MDWNEAREKFENDGFSYARLAEALNVSTGKVRYRAGKMGWKRKDSREGASEKPPDTETHEKKISVIADRLLGCIETAVGELDCYVIKNKVRTKETAYDEESGKADREVVYENEKPEFVRGPIDRAELKLLVGTLRDIRDIYSGSDPKQNKIEELIRGLCRNDEQGLQ